MQGVLGKAQLQAATGNQELSKGALIEVGQGSWVFHADAFDRKTGDVKVPRALPCSKPGSPELSRSICNSASASNGGAVGASLFLDDGFIGLSHNAYQSNYGTVAEDAVNIGIGDMEISLRPEPKNSELFDENLADLIDERELDSLGSELIDDFEKDQQDRKEWIQTYVEGLKLLGLRYEERTEPWQGACGVFHPMLTESVVRFQAEGIMETFPAAGPVKTKIIGRETPEKSKGCPTPKDSLCHLHPSPDHILELCRGCGEQRHLSAMFSNFLE
jgi:hypothetical protein